MTASRNAARVSLRQPKFSVSQPGGERVPTFRYRALTQNGESGNGALSAPTSAEVARRIEYLRLLPIETVEDKGARAAAGGYGWVGRPGAPGITTFPGARGRCRKGGARPSL